jgi:hypothetical protein
VRLHMRKKSGRQGPAFTLLLFESFFDLLLHPALVLLIQPAVSTFRPMKQIPDHDIDQPALPLEQPAKRTTRQVDTQFTPLPKAKRPDRPLFDQCRSLAAVILYLTYHSHNPSFTTSSFAYRLAD